MTSSSVLSARGAGAQATPGIAPVASPVGGGARYLFVGDRTQPAVDVYSIPGFEHAGRVDDVTFGTHGGALLLPDGRSVFADTTTNEIVALAVASDGGPEITDRVAADLGGGVAWMSASPSLGHLAVGSLQESEDFQYLNIVDLRTFTNTSLEFEMNEPEEITAWLLGDPLHVYVAVGGQIKSYLLDEALAENLEPLGTVEVELGSHGGATDAINDRIFTTRPPQAPDSRRWMSRTARRNT